MKTIICYLLILWILTDNIPNSINIQNNLDSKNNQNIQRKSLNYVIYANDVVEVQNKPENSRRDIRVFMDERSFNEENLVKLYKGLASKYPSPLNLFISIVTSFDQIPPPDLARLSDEPDDPEADKHHSGSCVRRVDGSEIIRFTTNPPSKNVKTIVIRDK